MCFKFVAHNNYFLMEQPLTGCLLQEMALDQLEQCHQAHPSVFVTIESHITV